MGIKENKNAGEIVKNGDFASLYFTRMLNYSCEEVWEALTDPAELSKWYMTKAKIEAREGGNIDFVSGPSRFHIKGKILVWDPPREFAHEWIVDPVKDLPSGENAVVKWTLEPVEGGTLLKLEHRNLSIRTAQGFAPGIHSFLDRLQAQLSGESLPNWQERIREVAPDYPDSWVNKR